MRSYVCTRDIHKRVMFANYIFANITSFAKFAKISSRENFQVHGIYIHIDRYYYMYLIQFLCTCVICMRLKEESSSNEHIGLHQLQSLKNAFGVYIYIYIILIT